MNTTADALAALLRFRGSGQKDIKPYYLFVDNEF